MKAAIGVNKDSGEQALRETTYVSRLRPGQSSQTTAGRQKPSTGHHGECMVMSLDTARLAEIYFATENRTLLDGVALRIVSLAAFPCREIGAAASGKARGRHKGSLHNFARR